MTRLIVSALVVLGVAATAPAHFVFIVAEPGGEKLRVVFSEDLEADPAVPIARVAGLKLTARNAAGKATPVPHTADKHTLTATLPESATVVFGSVKYGVMAKGDAKPFLLAYHPKAYVGAVPAGDPAVIGDALPAELVPVVEGGAVRFKLLGAGKPVADAEVTVLLPDGESKKVKTGPDGLTPAVSGTGRFGAWTRFFETKPGTHDGKEYAEVRHYPTVVLDTKAGELPPLPTPVSSFGAIACDGYVYAYGGHAGRVHHYDTRSVLGTFHRLKLDGGTRWEALPGGPILQGMNLAAAGGKVYRVGGMQPRNAPGDPADNVSVADCAVFDPAVGQWAPLPPLPAPRSSHDIVALDNQLVVVGGWNMRGRGESIQWHDTALVLDLAAPKPAWRSIPQPFHRRALTSAAVGGKVYVIAGFTEDDEPVMRVDILDVATGNWSTGPAVPGSGRAGFAPAACVVDGRVIVNTSAGPVYRLAADGSAWEQAGTATKRRIVARLVPAGPDSVLLLGGALGRDNIGTVERIRLTGQPGR